MMVWSVEPAYALRVYRREKERKKCCIIYVIHWFI